MNSFKLVVFLEVHKIDTILFINNVKKYELTMEKALDQILEVIKNVYYEWKLTNNLNACQINKNRMEELIQFVHKLGFYNSFSFIKETVVVFFLLLSNGRIIDKLTYIYRQISQTTNKLHQKDTKKWLNSIHTIEVFMNETSYTQNEHFFLPLGPFNPHWCTYSNFLNIFMFDEHFKQSFSWMNYLSRIINNGFAVHKEICWNCLDYPIVGTKYQMIERTIFNKRNGQKFCKLCFWLNLSFDESKNIRIKEFYRENKWKILNKFDDIFINDSSILRHQIMQMNLFSIERSLNERKVKYKIEIRNTLEKTEKAQKRNKIKCIFEPLINK